MSGAWTPIARAGLDACTLERRHGRRRGQRGAVVERDLAGQVESPRQPVLRHTPARGESWPQRALVVAEDRQRQTKLDALAPERSAIKALEGRKNAGSVWAGYADGLATQINQPLAGSPGGPLLLGS